MKEKILFLSLSVFFCVSIVFAESGTTGPLTWTLENGVLTISGTGDMPDYERRGDNSAPWRSNSYSIKEVIIAEGITHIGNNAFYGYSNVGDPIYVSLAKCSLPHSLSTIGYKSFCKCEGLSAITIPEGVTSIGESAFAECSGLQQVSLPHTLTAIEKWAFSGCGRLASISLPGSLVTIGDWAFYNCISLASITIPPQVTLISKNLFQGSGLIDIVIPDQVTEIEDEAFFACPALTSVTIPQGVTKMGVRVFSDCKKMKEIVVSDHNPLYASIDGVLFTKDKSLLILFPAAKSSSYSVPAGVVTIGESAFAECAILSSITFPSSLSKIENKAFADCTGLTAIPVSSGITEIKSDAFSGCTRLREFSASDDNTSFSTSEGVLYNKDKTTLLLFPSAKSTYFSIPKGVITIGENAFADCADLTNITLPSSVQTIGDGAFSGCNGLIRITLPSSVASIGREGFAACTRLRELHSRNPVPPSVGTDCFSEVDASLCRIFVPKGARADYRSADGWSGFKTVVEEIAPR